MLFLKKKLTKTAGVLSLILASTAAGFSYADTTAVAATTPQLSVQLWSVKDAMQADFEGTLTKLAAMGFDGVEFAGFFGKYANDAAGLKAFLNKLGLKASGAHVPFEKLSPEQLETTVAFYKAIDCNYLIIPMDQRAFTVEGAKAVAADLAAIQEKLTPEDGTGIGLTNLSRLFSLLGENDIQIFKDETEFKVEVPLIKP